MSAEEEAREIDITRIMEEIRDRIAEKKAAGVYSDEELEKISELEISLREREGFGEEIDRLLSWLHAHWESTGPVDAEGAPPARGLRPSVKKFLKLLLRPEGRLLLAKQNQINARIVQLLSGAIPPLRDADRDHESRIDGLSGTMEEENRKLKERVGELEARLDEIQGRHRGSPSSGEGQGK